MVQVEENIQRELESQQSLQKPNSPTVNHVIDLWNDNFSILENENNEELETIVHTTNTNKIIPKHVISEAEKYSGATLITQNQ